MSEGREFRLRAALTEKCILFALKRSWVICFTLIIIMPLAFSDKIKSFLLLASNHKKKKKMLQKNFNFFSF